MAQGTPGPIITDARGSIRGTTFRSTRNGLTLSGKAGPRSSTQSRSLAVRQLTAHAAQDWKGLSEADREIWSQAARVFNSRGRFGQPISLSARQAFFRSYLHQAGITDPIAPPPPSLGDPAAPLSGVFETWNSDLYLMALSRNLNPLDYCVFRARRDVPSYRAADSRTIHSYTTSAANGLDTLPFYSLDRTIQASHLNNAPGIPYAGDFTIEFWIYAHASPPAATREFIRKFGVVGFSLFEVATGDIRFVWGSATAVHGSPLPVGQWNYFAITYDSATGQAVAHLNSVPILSPAPSLAGNLTGLIQMGGAPSSPNVVDASFNQLVFSNTIRNGAYLSARYNAGVGNLQPPDGSTLALLPLRSQSGGLTPDITGNGHDFTTLGLSLFRGVPCLLIYANADATYPSPRTVLIQSQPLRDDWMLTAPSRQKVLW